MRSSGERDVSNNNQLIKLIISHVEILLFSASRVSGSCLSNWWVLFGACIFQRHHYQDYCFMIAIALTAYCRNGDLCYKLLMDLQICWMLSASSLILNQLEMPMQTIHLPMDTPCNAHAAIVKLAAIICARWTLSQMMVFHFSLLQLCARATHSIKFTRLTWRRVR